MPEIKNIHFYPATRDSILSDPLYLPNPNLTLHDMEKVNIKQELDSIEKYWSQQIIGQANGTLLKLAKGIGEVNWHAHDDQDEVFLVQKGTLIIRLRDRTIELNEGELFIVPKGVEHAPMADEEVELLVMGTNITSNEEGGKPEWSY